MTGPGRRENGSYRANWVKTLSFVPHQHPTAPDPCLPLRTGPDWPETGRPSIRIPTRERRLCGMACGKASRLEQYGHQFPALVGQLVFNAKRLFLEVDSLDETILLQLAQVLREHLL